MTKRKCFVFLLCLILCYSLFQSIVRAESLSQVNISSQGSISYSPSNVNLAVIPDDWGDYWIWGRITYGDDPQICFLDYDVERTAGSPSMRLERHTSADENTAREINGRWYPVEPGDHIYASCWIKIEDAQGNVDPEYDGGRIGIDLFGPDGTGDICIIDSYPHSGAEHRACMVHWGTPGWTQKTWEFIVPSTYYTEDANGRPLPEPTQITEIVAWVQALPATEPGIAWFADAELYINP